MPSRGVHPIISCRASLPVDGCAPPGCARAPPVWRWRKHAWSRSRSCGISMAGLMTNRAIPTFLRDNPGRSFDSAYDAPPPHRKPHQIRAPLVRDRACASRFSRLHPTNSQGGTSEVTGDPHDGDQKELTREPSTMTAMRATVAPPLMKPLTRTAAFIAPFKGKPDQRTIRRHRSWCPYCVALGESGFLTYHRARHQCPHRCSGRAQLGHHEPQGADNVEKVENRTT